MSDAITPTPEFDKCVEENEEKGTSISDCFRLIKFGAPQSVPAGASPSNRISSFGDEEETPSPSSGRSFGGQYYQPSTRRVGEPLAWSWRGL